MEGSDPATFELLQKVQLLHRRLIRGSELLVERDLEIRAKEQLCVELQAIAKRSPGPDAARKLLMTQVCILQVLADIRNWKQSESSLGIPELCLSYMDPTAVSYNRCGVQMDIN